MAPAGEPGLGIEAGGDPTMRRAPMVALGLAIVSLAGGCTLTMDFGPECHVDRDCKGKGRGLVCTRGYCVVKTGQIDEGPGGVIPVSTLISEDCREVYTHPQNSEDLPVDTIIFGILLPFSGELGAYGPAMRDGVLLAMSEIDQVGGLRGRKFAVVACDTGTEPDQAQRAAAHLALTVEVPAIIGPAASSIAIHVFNEVAHQAGVLVMTPSATSPAITYLDDDGLFWRTVPPDGLQGEAIARLLAAEEPGRVAVVHRDDAYGSGLRDVLVSEYCTLRSCTEETYRMWSYQETTWREDQSNIVLDLARFSPDALVVIGYVEDGSALLSMARMAGLAPARIILPDGLKSQEVAEQVGDQATLAAVLGTNPASPKGEDYDSFALRFQSKFRSSPGVFASNAYDAFYVLALAAACVPDEQELTGDRLAAGLARLSRGEEIRPGGSNWPRAASLLAASEDATIDYVGASGQLDFDPETGEAPSDVEAWRFDEDGRPESLGVVLTSDGEFIYPLDAGVDGPGAGDTGARDAGSKDFGLPDHGGRDAGDHDPGDHKVPDSGPGKDGAW